MELKMGRSSRSWVEDRLLAVCHRIFPRSVISLDYHVVSDRHLSHVANLLSYKSSAQFEQDLIYLLEAGRVITYNELHSDPNDRTAVSSIGFHLSFDDGYAECFTVVRPLLLKHKVPCTFFITTEFLDNRLLFYRNTASLCIEKIRSLDSPDLAQLIGRVNEQFKVALTDLPSLLRWIVGWYEDQKTAIDWMMTQLGIDPDGFLRHQKPYMTTQQVRQLADDGFTIGAHTLNHPRLNCLGNEQEIERQIVQSCRTIRDITGCDCVPFALPFDGIDVDRELIARIRSDHSYIGKVFDIGGIRTDQPFIQNRVVADHAFDTKNGRSNLPTLLLKSYASNTLYRIRQAFRRS